MHLALVVGTLKVSVVSILETSCDNGTLHILTGSIQVLGERNKSVIRSDTVVGHHEGIEISRYGDEHKLVEDDRIRFLKISQEGMHRSVDVLFELVGIDVVRSNTEVEGDSEDTLGQ